MDPYGLMGTTTPITHSLDPNRKSVVIQRVGSSASLRPASFAPLKGTVMTESTHHNNTYLESAVQQYGLGLLGQGVPAPPKNHNHIEYVPYQRKVVEYETREFVDRVPMEKTVIDHKQVKRIEYVPKEKLITDYYTIEKMINYVPQTIPEKKIEYVPVQKKLERVQYVPVTRQVIHYPQESPIVRSRSAQQLQVPVRSVNLAPIKDSFAINRIPSRASTSLSITPQLPNLVLTQAVAGSPSINDLGLTNLPSGSLNNMPTNIRFSYTNSPVLTVGNLSIKPKDVVETNGIQKNDTVDRVRPESKYSKAEKTSSGIRVTGKQTELVLQDDDPYYG